MGTFHQDKSQLHGITLVVTTANGETVVGRCDDEDSAQVVLLDADIHRDGDELSRADYLQKAFDFGVWPKHARVVIERAAVVSIQPLAEGLTEEQGA